MSRTEEILKEREKTHGSWERFVARYNYLNASLHDFTVKENKGARLSLSMIFVKIARILNDWRCIDHWEDIAGYATLVAKQLRKNEKKFTFEAEEPKLNEHDKVYSSIGKGTFFWREEDK